MAQTIINKVQPSLLATLGVMTMRDMTGLPTPSSVKPLCFSHAASTGPVQYLRLRHAATELWLALATGQILGMLVQHPRDPAEAPSSWADRNTVVPSCELAAPLCNEAARAWPSPIAPCMWPIPDFTKAPPWRQLELSLLAPAYLAAACQLGRQNQRMGNATVRSTGWCTHGYLRPWPIKPEYGTSHISIVDGLGNALVSMTTSIEERFWLTCHGEHGVNVAVFC